VITLIYLGYYLAQGSGFAERKGGGMKSVKIDEGSRC